MSELLAKPPTMSDVCSVWTASEFYAAIAPCGFAALADPLKALAPVTRRAHVAAAQAGLDWNPAGRYPISVWSRVYS